MNKYKIEDSYKKLDIINQWINNSDNKTSIVLAFVGILITIIFTNTDFISYESKVVQKTFEDLNFSNILYVIFVLLALCITLYGIWCLIKVLIPSLKKTTSSRNSFIYFGSISQYSNYKEYKEEYLKSNEEDLLDDLTNQIYQNSMICNKKYINFTNGVKYFLIGFLSMMVLYGIGILIYL